MMQRGCAGYSASFLFAISLVSFSRVARRYSLEKVSDIMIQIDEGMTYDFMSVSTVFQSYKDDDDNEWLCTKVPLFAVQKISDNSGSRTQAR